MKILSSFAASAFLSISMIMPAQASLVADQGEYTQHVFDCLGFLLAHPDQHGTECGGPYDLIPPSNLHEKSPARAPTCVNNLVTLPALSGYWQLLVAGNPCGGCASLLAPQMQEFFVTHPNGRLLVAC